LPDMVVNKLQFPRTDRVRGLQGLFSTDAIRVRRKLATKGWKKYKGASGGVGRVGGVE